MAQFDKAKAADRVWSIRRGWGTIETIVRIREGSEPICPIKVKFDFKGFDWFTFQGKSVKDDLYPELYWDEVHFEAPPPPERWIEKEKWIAFFRGHKGTVCVQGPELCESYREALSNTDLMCPDPIKVIVKEKED